MYSNKCYWGLLLSPSILISNLLLRMLGKYVASFVWTSTNNEWNVQNAIWSHAFGPSVTRYVITRVLTIYYLKLNKQGTALVQRRFDLGSLSPALPNLQFFTSSLCYLSCGCLIVGPLIHKRRLSFSNQQFYIKISHPWASFNPTIQKAFSVVSMNSGQFPACSKSYESRERRHTTDKTGGDVLRKI